MRSAPLLLIALAALTGVGASQCNWPSFAKDGCCYECEQYAWDTPVLHVDAAGVMKCGDGTTNPMKDVIRTNGSSTCIAITTSSGTTSSGTTTTPAPAAASPAACTGGSCGAAGSNCLCSALSNSGAACGYLATMGGDCSGCHNCPGSGWIMGTGHIGSSGTCTATCSSADSEWTACGLPAPPAGSVTKTACAATSPSTTNPSPGTTPAAGSGLPTAHSEQNMCKNPAHLDRNGDYCMGRSNAVLSEGGINKRWCEVSCA
ncbi:MAG: hypothetical protein ACPIOQ_82885, partial [Promethearchaeia archaeon]